MSHLHRCAARGCNKMIPGRHLMCRPDWQLVPQPIRNRVYATYRRGQTATTASPEYRKAMIDAIDAVTAAKATTTGETR